MIHTVLHFKSFDKKIIKSHEGQSILKWRRRKIKENKRKVERKEERERWEKNMRDI